MIKYDMDKAKIIWQNKIRVARKPLLEKLDIDFMRSTEEGKDTTTIVAQKQLLRDFPQKPEILAATNVEELAEVWDNELLGDKV